MSPHRPDYPPKTPPPPKKPVEPPRPEQKPLTPHPVRIRSRHVQNWAVPPSRGAADRIGQEVAKTLHRWGYRPKDDQPQKVVELLLRSAAQDGGRRVSLHLAEDEDRDQVMLLALSHRQDMPQGDDDQVLRDAEHMRALAALGPRDVGVETEPRGRRWWAGLDLPRPGQELEPGARRPRALTSGPKKLEGPPVPA